MQQNRYPLEELVGAILSPFEQFLRRTTAGGIVLMGTTVTALLIANLPVGAAFHHFWEQTLTVGVGGLQLHMSVHHFVNDGLMALFFLIVGLELKRELTVGELSSLRDAILPVIAAAGGMLAPALIYLAFNRQGAAVSGWGIPTATDIAFAVGILALLSRRIPRNLVIFLTALAIADDLGAVLIIAVFYTKTLNWIALGYVAICCLILAVLNRGGIRHLLPYGIAGLLLWLAFLESGIHATMAGVILASAIPSRPASASDRQPDCIVQSPQQRLEHALTPWVTFVVIPLFALVNAGISFADVAFGENVTHPVTIGVVSGLVLGKFIGIGGASLLAVGTGLAKLPDGVGPWHILGAAWLAGIGFTMSIFISGLAFPGDPHFIENAKLGILLGSLLAAIIGTVWLSFVASRSKR